MPVIGIKKQKQNVWKKGSTKVKFKKFLIVRIHDNMARARQTAQVFQIFCKLDQLLSEILQILKKSNDVICIINELNLQKNAKL